MEVRKRTGMAKICLFVLLPKFCPMQEASTRSRTTKITDSSGPWLGAKGQLISKCLFGIFNSPKKRTKKFDFTTMVPQVELFLFTFWEN